MSDSTRNEDQDHHPRQLDTDGNDREARFVELLAAYDESLASGPATAASSAGQLAPPDLQRELEEAKAWLEMIEQVWPRSDQGSPSARDPCPELVDPHAFAGDVHSPTPERETLRRLGRFQIQRELGRGGGGIVHLVFDPKLNRNVALKVPHPEFLFDPDLRNRFLHEAHVAARLDHPNIVPVYEIGEVGPMCYIASAYCHGPTLADWFESQDQAIPSRSAATMVMILAEAVEHAHRCHVLHRDLKPSNVLLEPRARTDQAPTCPPSDSMGTDCLTDFVPKLTDFGLAKTLEPDASVTRTGAVLGTPAYMAPEQADGRLQDVGPATDVYALGVILYELLTGQIPFRSDTDVRTLRQIVFEEPMAPRRLQTSISRDLEAICLKCLEKTPQARYASAADLAKDVSWFLAGHPTAARPANALKRLLKWSRRQPATMALMIVSLVSLLVILGISSRYRSSLGQAQQDVAMVRQDATRMENETSQRRLELKRHEYVDSVSDAYLAWSNARVTSALELLDRCRPATGEEDQRGFEWYYVRRLCEGGLRKMCGHQERPIHGSSFSWDGSRLATCGEDGSVQVWDPLNGQLLTRFNTQSGCVHDVGFSPDDQFLASVGDDGCVKLWDANTYGLTRIFEPSTGRLFCLAISPDGRTIAAAGEGGVITVWGVTDDERQTVISTDCETVFSLDFAADGKLAAACSDRTAKIWNLRVPSDPIRVVDPATDVFSVAFSPDGRRLATGGGLVHVWHLDSDRQPTYLPGHENYVRSVAFSADGKLLASAGNDEVIRIWDLTTSTTRHRYHAHTRPIFDLAFSSQGYLLASADKGGTVRIWNADTPQDRRPLPIDLKGKASLLAFSPIDNTLAIAASGRRDISLWRASADGNVQLLKRYSDDAAFLTYPHCITYSHNGRYIAVGTAKDWTIFDGNLTSVDTKPLAPLGPGVSQMAFSPDDKRVAISTNRPAGHLRIVDVESGLELMSLRGLRGTAFSPDGTLLAMESENTTFAVELWDLEKGCSQEIIPGHTGNTASIVFSANGRILASGSVDGSARLWDVQRHQEIHTLRGHAQGVVQIVFSPNQKSLVTASSDGTVQFWDVATGRLLLTLSVTSDQLESISFSADGQILATACQQGFDIHDSRVDLWYAPRVGMN